MLLHPGLLLQRQGSRTAEVVYGYSSARQTKSSHRGHCQLSEYWVPASGVPEIRSNRTVGTKRGAHSRATIQTRSLSGELSNDEDAPQDRVGKREHECPTTGWGFHLLLQEAELEGLRDIDPSVWTVTDEEMMDLTAGELHRGAMESLYFDVCTGTQEDVAPSVPTQSSVVEATQFPNGRFAYALSSKLISTSFAHC